MDLVFTLRAATFHVFTPDERLHMAFDHRGRLMTAHDGDRHWRVGLDGGVLERSGPPPRIPRRLDGPEADGLFVRAADLALVAWLRAERGELGLEAVAGRSAPASDHAIALLRRAADRGPRDYHADACTFREVWGAVPILPPDAQRALVVKVTEGCAWNRCLFCDLYRGVRYRVRTPDEVADHLDRIADLMGPTAHQRTRVFLGDANAVAAPVDRLEAAFDLVRRRFPHAAAGGFYSFMDGFASPSDRAERLARLAEVGLRRVYIGLESGDDELVNWLRKPTTPALAVQAVRDARAAGLGVGVIVLVGAGGDPFAVQHVAHTLEAIRAMELDRHDVVFLSPLVAGPAYEAEARESGITPLSDEAVRAQAQRFRSGLAGGRFQVATYDLRRWIY